MSQRIVERIKRLFKYHLVLRFIFDKLRYTGIHIIPYYLTQEHLNHELKPNIEAEQGQVVVSLLSPSEMETIYTELASKGLAINRATLAKHRCECFVLKVKEEIVASSWCNLHWCHYPLLSFPLKEDEAYLCSAATLNSYRGKNIAPFLRYEIYKYLEQIGRTKLYSVTEYFNTPAIKFKEKLGARQLKLVVCIRFFNRGIWNITLKKYRT